tara:strand:- start:814 stop:1257 length:444 start_codon:yes stop_codon:yes gene_type:complete
MNSMIRSLISVVGILVLVCGLSACGAGTTTVEILTVGNEMKYAVTQFTVPPETKVQLVLKNQATLPIMKHNIVILDQGTNIDEIGTAALTAADYLPSHSAILAATAIAGPNETVEVTFTAPSKPGRYPYICTFPGHYKMMQGVMIVE